MYRTQTGELRTRGDLEEAAIPFILNNLTHEELALSQVNMECHNIQTDLGWTRAVKQKMRDNDAENLAGVYADNATDEYLTGLVGWESE